MGDAGDKLGDIGSGLISSFVPGGAAAMGLVGSPMGQALGKQAANAAAIYKGSGRYARGRGIYTGTGSYADNSIISGDTLPVPVFSPERDGASVTISHREYVSDVYAPNAVNEFVNQSYAINPALERSFPWLSQVAANYEEYEIKQLIYTFRSTVTDFNSGTGQVGQVIMATQYNSNREPFYEKITMMQYDGAMSAKTSHTQMHGVECDPKKMSGSPGKFTRVSPVEEDQDKNDYDHAQFNIAVADVPSGFLSQAIGELWVSYTVHLRKPKFFTGRGLAISRDVFVTLGKLSGTHPWSNPGAGVTPGLIVPRTLSGQQNNIGCKILEVTPPGGGPLVNAILIPGTFAGNLKICGTLSDTTATGLSLPTPALIPVLQGSVQQIGDQPAVDVGTTTLTWAGIVNSYTSPLIAGGCKVIAKFELHVRVKVASGGIDNVIYLTYQDPQSSYDLAYLDIEEYNIGLNYSLNGSNDELKLVDDNGVVINI
jgi:hypothetical protein